MHTSKNKFARLNIDAGISQIPRRASMRTHHDRSARVMIALVLLLPSKVASFSGPNLSSRSRRSLSSIPGDSLSSRRRHGHGGKLYQVPLESADRIANNNGTDWQVVSQSQQSRHTLLEDADTLPVSDHDYEYVTDFERELLEGYVAHQSLLNYIHHDPEGSMEEQPELVTALSDATTISQTTSPERTASLSKMKQSTTVSTSTSILPNLSDVWKARLLLLLSAALYGTNFTFVKALDESMSVGLSSTLRFGFAAFAMLPWLFAPIDEELKISTSEEKGNTDSIGLGNGWMKWVGGGGETTRLSVTLVGMEIGMYASIGYIAQAVGLKTTTASKSAFICSMAVVTVPILDYIWGKQLLRRQVLGACLAAVGVYALEMGGQESFNSGDMMSLVQPLMFGLGFWRMEAAMERYPTEAARLAAAQLLMVFVMSLSYMICDLQLSDTCNALPSALELSSLLQDPSILGMLFWTGIVTTAFTIYMETLALKTLSAAETTLIFSTEPLFGAAFAAVVANECLGTEAAIGAAFIIGGCIVSGVDVGGLVTGGNLAAVEAATEKE